MRLQRGTSVFNRMLKGFSAIVLLMVVTAPVGAVEVKIGVVNVPALLKGSPQAEKVQTKLRQEFEPRSKELGAQQSKIKAAEEEFSKNGVLLSEEQRGKKEREIIAQRRDFNHAKEAFEDDFRLRQSEELGGLREQLVKAVDEFGRSQKYDVILAEGVIFASDTVDVTEPILKILKAQ